jgi:hypothetical protein
LSSSGEQIGKLLVGIQAPQLITKTQVEIAEALGCPSHTSGFCGYRINAIGEHGYGFLPLSFSLESPLLEIGSSQFFPSILPKLSSCIY